MGERKTPSYAKLLKRRRGRERVGTWDMSWEEESRKGSLDTCLARSSGSPVSDDSLALTPSPCVFLSPFSGEERGEQVVGGRESCSGRGGLRRPSLNGVRTCRVSVFGV